MHALVLVHCISYTLVVSEALTVTPVHATVPETFVECVHDAKGSILIRCSEFSMLHGTTLKMTGKASEQS